MLKHLYRIVTLLLIPSFILVNIEDPGLAGPYCQMRMKMGYEGISFNAQALSERSIHYLGTEAHLEASAEYREIATLRLDPEIRKLLEEFKNGNKKEKEAYCLISQPWLDEDALRKPI